MGFAFLAYEDQRSTTLAVDNISGFKLLGRTLKVREGPIYLGTWPRVVAQRASTSKGFSITTSVAGAVLLAA